jgi:glycosyltransferase involved in cell wall biosynthesis
MSSTLHPVAAASRASSDAVRLSDLVVLIPVWQPEPVLIGLVQQLVAAGFAALLIIDDGSRADYTTIFQQLELMPGVQLLRHAANRGKGRSLKTGFEYVLVSLPQVQGVITADADGQHTVPDILHVAETLCQSPQRVVLGSRVFASEVPRKSRFGNLLTRRLFGLLAGVRLCDTQTGLRGLPRNLLATLSDLPGERYEYEMSMLAHLCRSGHIPVEVPIQTVYFDGNRGSHFHPIWDSLRIYLVLLRSSLSAKQAAVSKATPNRECR